MRRMLGLLCVGFFWSTLYAWDKQNKLFSPDGRYCAEVREHEGRIVCTKGTSQRVLWSMPTECPTRPHAAFSPDSKSFIVTRGEGKSRGTTLVECASGIARWKRRSCYIKQKRRYTLFSLDSEYCYMHRVKTPNAAPGLDIVSVATGDVVGFCENAFGAVFSPKSRYVLFCGRANASCYDFNSGTQLWCSSFAAQRVCSFSANEVYCALSLQDGQEFKVRILESSTGEEVQCFEGRDPVFEPGSNKCCMVEHRGTLRSVDVITGEVIWQQEQDSYSTVSDGCPSWQSDDSSSHESDSAEERESESTERIVNEQPARDMQGALSLITLGVASVYLVRDTIRRRVGNVRDWCNRIREHAQQRRQERGGVE